ncbi:MAG: zinc-ribbon domain-containing protein, partial [Alphaproteobacteria bacterium]
MIITCPNCATRYQVSGEAFSTVGRKVRCRGCRFTWYVAPEADIPEPADDIARDSDDVETEPEPEAEAGPGFAGDIESAAGTQSAGDIESAAGAESGAGTESVGDIESVAGLGNQIPQREPKISR